LGFNLAVGLIAGIAHELLDVPDIARERHKTCPGSVGEMRQLAHHLMLVVVVGRRAFRASTVSPIRREHLV
jgi:hypothetical protein